MTPSFDRLHSMLKRLPGLGTRSAERIALHLLLDKPDRGRELSLVLEEALNSVHSCERCGHVTEDKICSICADPRRDHGLICVVEQVPDVLSMEKSGSFKGIYLVLGGKLSPLQNVGPDDLNFHLLSNLIDNEEVNEIILALSNDIEGEATCHYIQEALIADKKIKVSRIGFGLPSGGGLLFADPGTLQSAMESRKRI